MKPVLVFRHTPHCPLGSIASYLTEGELSYRYIDLYAEIPQKPPLEESSGLIVLGGPMSVNDTEMHPFLLPELDWIREAVEMQLPTLGVCLGSQLLARALGERVYANHRKEIGWYQIEILQQAADDDLFAGCRPTETVFHWHGDTFDLPAKAVHLARSELCENQAFRYGPSAYGLQFHVEMTPEIMAEWFAEPELHSQIGNDADPLVIQRDAARRFPAMITLSRHLLTRFATLCRRRMLGRARP